MTLSDDKCEKIFESLEDGCFDAIEAAMDFFEVMEKHQESISIQGLSEGLDLAINEGHEVCEFYLAMLINAVRLARERKSS